MILTKGGAGGVSTARPGRVILTIPHSPAHSISPLPGRSPVDGRPGPGASPSSPLAPPPGHPDRPLASPHDPPVRPPPVPSLRGNRPDALGWDGQDGGAHLQEMLGGVVNGYSDIKFLQCGTWKSLTMLRETPPYPFHDKEQIQAIAAHYAGHQCEHGKGGWICPHRKASLGSLTPVDGIITCPLHGLRIEAESGRVVG